MFKKYADFIVRRRWYVVVGWIVAGVLISALAPSLSSVTSNDQASFLPSKYESAEAQEIAKQAFPNNQGQPAIILMKRSDNAKLTTADQAKIVSIAGQINAANINHIKGATSSAQMLSQDQKIQLITASATGDPQSPSTMNSIKELRDKLTELIAGTNLTSAVTGEVAISYDMQNSSSQTEKIVGLVTVLLILVLPTIVFRSPFAGLLSIISVGIVYLISMSLLAIAASALDFKVSGQLTSLLIVVLFGIGTDYILFLLFRYRERLRSGDHSRAAVSFALERASKAILSAALVVATAFAALFAAKFGFLNSLAPGLVICVILMLIAAMTLVPALLAIVQDKIFWPSKKWQKPQKAKTFSTRIANTVANHPGRVTIVILIAITSLLFGLTEYKTTFDLISQLPSGTESSQAYKEMASNFPAGQASPVQVFVKSNSPLSQADLAPLIGSLAKADGVKAVIPVMAATTPVQKQAANSASSSDSELKSKSYQLSVDKAPARIATKTSYAAQPQMAQLSTDKRVALITLLLADDPNSNAAIEAVNGPIRAAAHSTTLNAKVYVGGQTAAFADLKDATNRDITVVAPLAAVIILIILVILLRSLVAPLYLLVAVGLGVLATLGATSYIFVGLGDSAGLMFMMPILLYLFVVAVGTDYNILMITRLREEIHDEGLDTKLAVVKAIEHTAPTLASAGLILAGTFASLILAGLSLLIEMGFAVTFGIALGAFVISMLLIPALSILLGRYAWWPHREKVK